MLQRSFKPSGIRESLLNKQIFQTRLSAQVCHLRHRRYAVVWRHDPGSLEQTGDTCVNELLPPWSGPATSLACFNVFGSHSQAHPAHSRHSVASRFGFFHEFDDDLHQRQRFEIELRQTARDTELCVGDRWEGIHQQVG